MIGKVKERQKDGDAKWKTASETPKSGSSNLFAILDTIMKNEEAWEEELCSNEDDIGLTKAEQLLPKKARAASVRMAELMKTLKSKRKGPIDKWKSKISKTGSFVLRSSSSLNSL